MARTFTITCAAGTIRLAGQARGECSFTVTNTTAAAVRAQPAAVALDGRAGGWFTLPGGPLLELAAGQTVQVTVAIAPTGAPPGRYAFRLDVTDTGSGERSTGPEACVELTSAAPPPPPGRRPFPWWWLLLAAALLLALALTLWLVLARRPPPAAPEPAAPGAEGAAVGDQAGDAGELAERWLAAFAKDDARALAALTSTPALITGTRATDQGALLRLYAALVHEGRPAGLARAPGPAPARPVLARVREISAKLPPEARALGLGDDDHAVGVTVAGSDQRFVLLIRHGPPPRIAGVLR